MAKKKKPQFTTPPDRSKSPYHRNLIDKQKDAVLRVRNKRAELERAKKGARGALGVASVQRKLSQEEARATKITNQLKEVRKRGKGTKRTKRSTERRKDR